MLMKNSRVLYQGGITGTGCLRDNLSRRILREECCSYTCHCFCVITSESPYNVLI
jgi:hypothetical protein